MEISLTPKSKLVRIFVKHILQAKLLNPVLQTKCYCEPLHLIKRIKSIYLKQAINNLFGSVIADLLFVNVQGSKPRWKIASTSHVFEPTTSHHKGCLISVEEGRLVLRRCNFIFNEFEEMITAFFFFPVHYAKCL